jgi:hypothetical protein
MTPLHPFKDGDSIDGFVSRSWLTIKAFMYYPENSEETYKNRELYFKNASLLLQLEEHVDKGEVLKKILLPVHLVYEALHYGHLTTVNPEMLKAGFTAGQVLVILRAMKIAQGSASLNEAFDRVIEIRLDEYHSSSPRLFRSKTEIKSAWKRYKAVAHLWAADILRGMATKHNAPQSIGEFKNFIATANDHLTFGIEYKNPYTKRVTILDKENSWRIPQFMDLSEAKVYSYPIESGDVVTFPNT